MDITTIKLQKETKERLEKLKESRRESYDDILRKVLYVLNITRDNPNKAKLILERIDELRKRMLDEENEEKKEQKKDKLNLKKNNSKKISSS
ncbi:MAG: hypothetical protein PHX15_01005 [Candidatus Nanoarchaeia archaeon]|jgi:hypothetical protein|nr:hypothetical protein [Candidatus Nanoarchaeia archaeon]MDD3993759.1 hypothetical protein [Candidatus Nanoarchaeia archaeon]MDD4563495.1 hypothetical protein [Candidatus Nanoarchaeia archaeon]